MANKMTNPVLSFSFSKTGVKKYLKDSVLNENELNIVEDTDYVRSLEENDIKRWVINIIFNVLLLEDCVDT